MSEPDNMQDQLEQMMDKVGIGNLIQLIGCVCSEKADHIRYNWQDRPLAAWWDKTARTLERFGERVKDYQFENME